MKNEYEGHWMETYTGKKFFLLNPCNEDIVIEDIAHHLSLLCRFTGACRGFYSVAEHSVRLSHIVKQGNELAGLLHDAPEAYLADISRPVKVLFPEYRKLEGEITKAIMQRFGINGYDKADIKRADNAMLATEGRDLMDNIDDWFLPEAPLKEEIHPIPHEMARTLFLDRFHELRRR